MPRRGKQEPPKPPKPIVPEFKHPETRRKRRCIGCERVHEGEDWVRPAPRERQEILEHGTFRGADVVPGFCPTCKHRAIRHEYGG